MPSRYSLKESPDCVDNVGKYLETIGYDIVPTITFMIRRDGMAFASRRQPENTETIGPSDGHTGLYQAIIPQRYRLSNEQIAEYEERVNVCVRPATFETAKDLQPIKCFNGRIYVDEGIVTFWDPLTSLFPTVEWAMSKILQLAGLDRQSLKIEYWMTAQTIDTNLYRKWDDGRHDAKSLLIPYTELNNFLADVHNGAQQQHSVPQGERHVIAAKGLSNPVVPGSGTYREQNLAAKAGYDTVAAFHAAHPFESQNLSLVVRQILGEDIPGSTDADVTADEFPANNTVDAYYAVDFGTTRQFHSKYPGGTRQACDALTITFKTEAAGRGVRDDEIRRLKVQTSVHAKLKQRPGGDVIVYGVITVTGPLHIILKFGDWLKPIEL